MKRLATLAGLAFASLIGAFAFTTPAHATPTCSAYTDSSATYPADSAGHEQVCFAATTADKTAIATAVRQLPRKSGSGPNEAYDYVAAQGVKVFFFSTEADAISYFQNTAPWSSTMGYATGGQQCGFTFSGPAGIVASVYKTCLYGSTNPDLAHTIKHEMGHAFDFTMKIVNGISTTPSQSTGYSGSTTPPNYNLDGLNLLTPSNWSTLTTTQKASVVCGIFSNINSSPLEQAFGAPAGSVCMTSGSTMVVNTAYVGMTPTQIASTFMPKFLNAQEAWAEQFALHVGVQTPPASPFLQLTDRIFINTNFKCSVFDVSTYSDTGIPPTNTQITAHGCAFTQTQLK